MRRAGFVAMSALLVFVLTTASRAGEEDAGEWPGWGFTHTQFSADRGDTSSLVRSLASQPMLQNQHIMGWGALNPEPAPGVYDFTSLDRRIDFIRASRGVPVITLCCAPDWMKGGAAGETDWDRLAVAPAPAHYDDFAALSGTIAARYPDVRHFLVWNEFKGFFDESAQQWDAKAYTTLYDKVYRAVKGVNPANQVGGPYIDMGSPPWDGYDSALAGRWGTVDQRALDAFEYWLQHKIAADFVVVDGSVDEDADVEPAVALEKFSAVSRWIRSRTDLPLWWAEWYVESSSSDSTWSEPERLAIRTAATIEFARSGVHAALYWNPPPEGADCMPCLWTDTGSLGGGQQLPFLTFLQRFVRWFPPGTVLEDIETPDGVHLLARSGLAVVVNTRGSPANVVIDGHNLPLVAYETLWIRRPSARLVGG